MILDAPPPHLVPSPHSPRKDHNIGDATGGAWHRAFGKSIMPFMPDLRVNSESFGALRGWVAEFDLEPEHAYSVCKTSLALFDQLLPLFALDVGLRPLLEAAALLHDIGHTRDCRRHHKHSRDIIMALDLPVFSEDERKMVACVARYHRKSEPQAGHKLFRGLAPKAQDAVQGLAAILRIADGLDRSHEGMTEGLRVSRKRDHLRILLRQRHPNPTDIWGGMRKRALFERVFGLRVDIAPDSD